MTSLAAGGQVLPRAGSVRLVHVAVGETVISTAPPVYPY